MTVWISRTSSSIRAVIRTIAPLPPARYVMGRPPRQACGTSGPPSASRITRASRYDIGMLMILGMATASLAGIRFAPGTDAHPGVSGSPGTRKSKGMPPRWMWLSGPHGSVRIRLPLLVPIVRRIRVDEDAREPTLLRGERLEAAVAVGHRVANQRDFAPEVDALRGQPVVVLGIAAARVHDRRRDFTRRREGVVGEARVLARCRHRPARRPPSARPARRAGRSSRRARPADREAARRA